jgi:hypothetical protein
MTTSNTVWNPVVDSPLGVLVEALLATAFVALLFLGTYAVGQLGGRDLPSDPSTVDRAPVENPVPTP